MAISFVNAGAVAAVASGNLSVAAPAAIASGDILVLGSFSRDLITPSADNGYTLKQAGTQNNRGLYVFWKRTTGTEGSTTVTHTAGDAAVAVIVAYRGCNSTGDPFDSASGSSTGGSATTCTCTSLTTVNDNAVVLLLVGSQGQSTYTLSSGGNLSSTTERVDATTALPSLSKPGAQG